MSLPVFEVSVIVRRVPLVNRWVSEKWEVEAVEPSSRAPAAVDSIERETLSEDRYRWHGFRLDLHPSEGEGYFLNLREPEPRAFVMWRFEDWNGEPTAKPWVVTASYNEAARMMDAGETVDSVPLPAEIHAWIEPWLIANYKPEVRKKKQRNQEFWGDRKDGRGNGQGAGRAATVGDTGTPRGER